MSEERTSANRKVAALDNLAAAFAEVAATFTEEEFDDLVIEHDMKGDTVKEIANNLKVLSDNYKAANKTY